MRGHGPKASSALHLGTVGEGARNLVRKALRLAAGERFVVLSDRACEPLMRPVLEVARQRVGATKVSWHLLEDLGDRDPARGLGLDPTRAVASRRFATWLRDLRRAQAGVFAAVSLGEEFLLRRRIVEAAVANGGRFLLLPNLTEDILCMGFCVDLDAAQEYTRAVLRLARGAAWAEVTSPAGTDAWVRLGLRWVAAGSVLGRGEWANVGAEIYTCPISMDGVWVADGGMGDVFTRYGLLGKRPLRLELKGGRAVAAHSSHPGLARHFRRYADGDPLGNGWRVGEFALSTSPELTELGLVGVNMQDEKALTHIACGDPRPALTMEGIVPKRFEWGSSVHVDLTARTTTVTLHPDAGPPVRILEEGRPSEAVFAAMEKHGDRLKRRLELIRAARARNDSLPPRDRAKLLRLDP